MERAVCPVSDHIFVTNGGVRDVVGIDYLTVISFRVLQPLEGLLPYPSNQAQNHGG